MPAQLVDSPTVLLADAANVADWIAAIGQAAGALFTAGAVGVAVWLGWRDRRWRREDQAAARAEQADRDAAQARLVTVEVADELNQWDWNAFTVVVHNGSSDPIFEVKIAALTSEDQEECRWVFYWGPVDPWPEVARVLLAGKSMSWMVARADERRQTIPSGGNEQITIEYTDSVGLRWKRTDGQAPRRNINPPDGGPA